MDPITPRTTGARDLSDAGIRLRPPPVAKVRPRTVAARPLGQPVRPKATGATGDRRSSASGAGVTPKPRPDAASAPVTRSRSDAAAPPQDAPAPGPWVPSPEPAESTPGLDLDAWGDPIARRGDAPRRRAAPRPADPAVSAVPVVPERPAAPPRPAPQRSVRTRTSRAPRPVSSARPADAEPVADPTTDPRSTWFVPAVPDEAAPAPGQPQSSWTVVRPSSTTRTRAPDARRANPSTTGRRERGSTAPPATRPARPRPASTRPVGRTPASLADALGHLDRQQRSVRTVFIDDYSLDDYGVERVGSPGTEALPAGRHARAEEPEPRPVFWPAVALVVLVAVLAVLLSVL